MGSSSTQDLRESQGRENGKWRGSCVVVGGRRVMCGGCENQLTNAAASKRFSGENWGSVIDDKIRVVELLDKNGIRREEAELAEASHELICWIRIRIQCTGSTSLP
ncbi:hypothetical protein COLO4_21688 [Corchorus olitorius]|uniref:Uncharacterized protein n=1 Tax=Corchorus olitorius TaxID=93759 RepID=A0A1R3IRQ8_9ROSI|nr:hypothetical protein COLO4_21688 [Corchorus olitorius]